ncbi:hypothetical protein [Piscicoccus intestinalis]|uniref:hypothetical protein n=1 Tax=Piscicoccus intestinalis TaxID=746033 RepID=UPI0008392FD1|nr:hypothetical protein [Piscicoccus intestinalis]
MRANTISAAMPARLRRLCVGFAVSVAAAAPPPGVAFSTFVPSAGFAGWLGFGFAPVFAVFVVCAVGASGALPASAAL